MRVHLETPIEIEGRCHSRLTLRTPEPGDIAEARLKGIEVMSQVGDEQLARFATGVRLAARLARVSDDVILGLSRDDAERVGQAAAALIPERV